MKKNYLFTLLIALISITFLNAQTTLTAWNFDSSSTAPSTGTGTLSLIGGTVASATAYPTGNPAAGKSYSITTFPASTTASVTAGYLFAVNTNGYSGITVSFDILGTNPSSKWQQFEYTTNGTTWTSLGNNAGGLTTGFAANSFNLPATCDNNSNFAFRIVSVFRQPNNDKYASIQAGNNYATTGAWQIDNVKFTYNTLGVSQNMINNLRIYPNPTKTVLNITSDSFEVKNVEIYNVLGKVVLTTKTTNTPINVAGLTSGVYIVKVTQEGKTATRRLVIE